MATESSRASYGHFTASGQRIRPPEPSDRRRGTLAGDGGLSEGGVDATDAMESDSRSSGEDEDVSVCSLDVTSSPTDVADSAATLNTQQIEAS